MSALYILFPIGFYTARVRQWRIMLTLNAFTNGFHGFRSTTDVCTPRYVRWVYGVRDFDGITLFEDGWMYHEETPRIKSAVRLGWLVEPRSLRPENYERVWGVVDNFDYILTYDAELLRARPDKFLLCPRMGTHLPRERWGIRAKTRNIAMITTRKNSTEGHRLRREVARVFGARVDVYGQGVWADKETALAPYRYAVVVENERAENWFTEHLLDAVALGCVPLYWGAPNIWEWLEARGVMAWETLDELRALLDTATPQAYMERAEYIAGNFARIDALALAEDWAYMNIFSRMVGGG